MGTTDSPKSSQPESGSPEPGFDAGTFIMHHILDSREIEVPFTGQVIHLPEWKPGGVDLSPTRSVAMMWVASALLLVLLLAAARRAKEAVPRGIRSVVEIFVLFIRDEIARKALGHDADRYLGYLLTTFFFILTCNLLGLVPGMSTATSSISVTAALAGMAFVMIQLAGMREHGVLGHLRNLLPHGIPAWLVPILLPAEILGVFTKPFALCIRLFANMTAGHVVILSLVSLIFIMQTAYFAAVSIPLALFVYLLEILVAFLQAFIFTLLTAYFISMAAHPSH